MQTITRRRMSVFAGLIHGTVPLPVAFLLMWQCGCSWSRTDADRVADCIVAAAEPLCATPGRKTAIASCTPEGAGSYLLVLLPHGQSDVRDSATRGLSELELRVLEGVRQNAPELTTVAVFNDDRFSATVTP